MEDMVYVSVRPFDSTIYVCLTLFNHSSRSFKTRGNFHRALGICSQFFTFSFLCCMSVGGLQGCFPGTFLDRGNFGASAEGWPVVVSHAVRPVHWQRLPYTAALFATWNCYLRFTQYTTLKGTRPRAKFFQIYTRLRSFSRGSIESMIERTTDPWPRLFTSYKPNCK